VCVCVCVERERERERESKHCVLDLMFRLFVPHVHMPHVHMPHVHMPHVHMPHVQVFVYMACTDALDYVNQPGQLNDTTCIYQVVGYHSQLGYSRIRIPIALKCMWSRFCPGQCVNIIMSMA
jgi:hypothetical protein